MRAPQIFILVDGENQGSFSSAELAALWTAGELGPDALYWHRGLDAWMPVADFQAPTDAHTTPAHRIRITTESTVAGATIEEDLGVITAEVVEGVSVLAELSASITDLVGGRNERFEALMGKVHGACLTMIRDRARGLRADAVVGLRLTPLSFSGKGSLFFVMTAVGTAVSLAPVPPPPPAVGS